jgi:hypothetical protein
MVRCRGVTAFHHTYKDTPQSVELLWTRDTFVLQTENNLALNIPNATVITHL